jgi:hypothetical protein
MFARVSFPREIQASLPSAGNGGSDGFHAAWRSALFSTFRPSGFPRARIGVSTLASFAVAQARGIRAGRRMCNIDVACMRNTDCVPLILAVENGA